jgi:hypothetical protein
MMNVISVKMEFGGAGSKLSCVSRPLSDVSRENIHFLAEQLKVSIEKVQDN